MAVGSNIEWTNNTWNPTTGCDRISPGCNNCYALNLSKRLKAMEQGRGTTQPKYQTDGDPRTSGPGFGIAIHEDELTKPLKWRKPRKIFVNSMSDLFHAKIPNSFVQQVFDVMAATPQHTYQILTKRALRLSRLAPDLPWPPNVWMGVSVENVDYLPRVDQLRAVPAAVRWVSAEPLLGPLDGLDLAGIDWLVIGGESDQAGQPARPMELTWVRDLLAACRRHGAAPFVKQLGSRWGKDHHDINRFPEDLQVREYPQIPALI